jgi:hypothetical protein
MKDFKSIDGHIVLIDDPWNSEESISDEDRERFQIWFNSVFERPENIGGISVSHESDPTVKILK